MAHSDINTALVKVQSLCLVCWESSMVIVCIGHALRLATWSSGCFLSYTLRCDGDFNDMINTNIYILFFFFHTHAHTHFPCFSPSFLSLFGVDFSAMTITCHIVYANIHIVFHSCKPSLCITYLSTISQCATEFLNRYSRCMVWMCRQ